MKSGHKVSQSGLYRTACCGEEMVLMQNQTLPPCKNCNGQAEWELLRANGEHEEAA